MTLAALIAADLHDAVQAGDLEAVRQEIARGADVNRPDRLGATPLHDAAWNGNLAIAAYLIEHGADVKARHAEGGSQPIAYAVIKNDRAMVELLFAHGADVKSADNSGATLLHLAVDRGYQQLVDLLIEKAPKSLPATKPVRRHSTRPPCADNGKSPKPW